MTMEVVLIALTVNCVYTEDTVTTTVGSGTTVVTCPCGRWRITLAASPDEMYRWAHGMENDRRSSRTRRSHSAIGATRTASWSSTGVE